MGKVYVAFITAASRIKPIASVSFEVMMMLLRSLPEIVNKTDDNFGLACFIIAGVLFCQHHLEAELNFGATRRFH